MPSSATSMTGNGAFPVKSSMCCPFKMKRRGQHGHCRSAPHPCQHFMLPGATARGPSATQSRVPSSTAIAGVPRIAISIATSSATPSRVPHAIIVIAAVSTTTAGLPSSAVPSTIGRGPAVSSTPVRGPAVSSTSVATAGCTSGGASLSALSIAADSILTVRFAPSSIFAEW
ncbi:UNVERIFIED_CONTAM: hypothetical protein FKN15_033977 [Acipenser sinensis]